MAILTGLAAMVLFIIASISGWQWMLIAGYRDRGEVRAFESWMDDPLNAGRQELIHALCYLGGSLILIAAICCLQRWRGRELVRQEAARAETTEMSWKAVRTDLICTVRKHWIEDWLREMPGCPCMIERASGERVLLKEVVLLKLFDDSGGLLVIQGAPGSGKSFSLVQLAEQLLKRADEDTSAPVPVVVPLASWAVKGLPLEEWLAEELQHHYGLSKRDTVEQLASREKRLTLLVDGLDEVRSDARADCLQAILQFKENATASIVLCCGVEEYGALPLPVRPACGEAILMLPLSPGQADAYLAAGGQRLTALRQRIQTNPEWMELASSPLMLNLLAEGYSHDDTEAEDNAPALTTVFTRYVKGMFRRKERLGSDGKTVPEVAPFVTALQIHWLQQIAKRLERDGKTTYWIDRMQPSWAESRWQIELFFGLVGGVVFGLSLGLVGGLVVGFGEGFVGALLLGLFFGVIGGPMAGLVAELAGDLITRLLRRVAIRLVETLHLRFDWRRFPEALVVGLVFGVCTGLFSMLAAGLFGGLFLGLVGGLVVGLVSGVIAGLIGVMFEFGSHPEPAQPNQGVRNTGQTCLRATMFCGLGGWILGSLFDEAVAVSILGASLAFIVFGGYPLMQHYALRLTLAWEGVLPHPFSDRKLVAFLDAMRDRMLLVRVGGGWMFRHKRLLEFMAAEPFGANARAIEEKLRGDGASGP